MTPAPPLFRDLCALCGGIRHRPGLSPRQTTVATGKKEVSPRRTQSSRRVERTDSGTPVPRIAHAPCIAEPPASPRQRPGLRRRSASEAATFESGKPTAHDQAPPPQPSKCQQYRCDPIDQTLNLKSITSPSSTTYSLPSIRYNPFSRAAPIEPHWTRSL